MNWIIFNWIFFNWIIFKNVILKIWSVSTLTVRQMYKKLMYNVFNWHKSTCMACTLDFMYCMYFTFLDQKMMIGHQGSICRVMIDLPTRWINTPYTTQVQCNSSVQGHGSWLVPFCFAVLRRLREIYILLKLIHLEDDSDRPSLWQI